MRKKLVKISQSFLTIFLLTGLVGTAGASFDNEAQAFVDLINNYRAQNNLGVLSVDSKLEAGAIWMSDDMLNNCVATGNRCSHDDSTGRKYSTRLSDFGYPSGSTYTAENIAWGIKTAQQAFDLWKSSKPHNANMLGNKYGAIGISRSCNSDGNCAWVTDFGSQLVELYKHQKSFVMVRRYTPCWQSQSMYNPRCWNTKIIKK